MTIKQLVWRIGVPLLIIAACSPAATTPTAPAAAALFTQPATLGPIVTATDLPATAIPATEVPATEVLATPVPATEVAAVPDIAGRPSAPAGPGEYRSDPETLVGATGNPQLLEFFTTW